MILNTPIPHVGSFLVISVCNLDQFLTSPHCRRRLRLAPRQSGSKGQKTLCQLLVLRELEQAKRAAAAHSGGSWVDEGEEQLCSHLIPGD
jgi:hypothetical protein